MNEIIEIRPVQSGQSKAVIGIAGQSGDGKTLSALYVARGMVNKASEIGFLDTENKRGSLYADVLDDKFLIGDLFPPFSPSRYAAAIKQFQNAGVKVLIIDSVTHEWEGEGGCDDIANSPKADGSARKVPNWIGAKREHKTFMNVLLQSNMDIICCIRAREKVKVETINGKQEFVTQGIQPVCEKNFMFEMTASIMMAEQGKRQIHLKVPSFLSDVFGTGSGYLGVENGKKLRKWLDKGEKENPEIEKIKSEALLVCDKGTEELTKLWNSLSKEHRKNPKLISHFGLCGESAKAYDLMKLENEETSETEIQLNEINTLLVEVMESLNEEEKNQIKAILDGKITQSYSKVISTLKSKKNV